MPRSVGHTDLLRARHPAEGMQRDGGTPAQPELGVPAPQDGRGQSLQPGAKPKASEPEVQPRRDALSRTYPALTRLSFAHVVQRALQTETQFFVKIIIIIIHFSCYRCLWESDVLFPQ